jgi:CheY-like chemotaxis protein/HPt (histidine-containing phosphotransfer) domain-containing protein
MNQQLIRHLMENWGIDFTLVGNGQEAVDALKREAFSVVLMDMQMPVMDGYTATEVIRRDLRSDIPIVAMTAHAMVGEKEKCLEIGMNDYVSKPLKEEALYNIIARYAQYNAHAGPILTASPEDDTPAADEPSFRLIDFSYLRELSGGNQEFELEMLNQFVAMMPEELQIMDEQIRKPDFEEVRKLAHGMKSSVSYVGMSESLFPHLSAMEEGAERGDQSVINTTFATVRAQVEGAMEEIRAFLDGRTKAVR